MRIRSLTLKDYGGFTDATVDLDRPLTVLCGVNGSGKSSLLTACAMAISDVLYGVTTHKNDIWRYLAQDADIRCGASQLSLKITLSNGNIERQIALSHYAGQESNNKLPSDDGDRLARGAIPLLSVFYDASRQVGRAEDAVLVREEVSSKTRPYLLSAINDSFADGHLKFRSLFQWFKAREDVENELKVSKQDFSIEDPQLASVRRAVAGMVPGFSGLRIQRDPLHMVIRKGDEALLIDQLSDGEKLLLALTADLARRLAIAYADRGDPLEGEAVVLIDEIELHLHPAWQRRVLADLRRTFPNCQFIVTTHSPQVLSEVPNDAVILVQDFQFFRPAAPTEGRDSNAILWEVLGVGARPHAVVKEIEAISGLLDDGKDGEAREKLDRLARALTERDPDVARLRGILDVAERIDAGDHEGA